MLVIILLINILCWFAVMRYKGFEFIDIFLLLHFVELNCKKTDCTRKFRIIALILHKHIT